MGVFGAGAGVCCWTCPRFRRPNGLWEAVLLNHRMHGINCNDSMSTWGNNGVPFTCTSSRTCHSFVPPSSLGIIVANEPYSSIVLMFLGLFVLKSPEKVEAFGQQFLAVREVGADTGFGR